jgi:hypothetical protein
MNVLYNRMADHGRSWFVGAIFIMSVATYIFAVYIGNVLDFFRWPPRRLGGGGKKARSEDPPNVWRLLWHCGEATFSWLRDVGRGNTDSSRPSTDDEKPEEIDQSSQVSQRSKNEQKLMEDGKANCLLKETDLVEEQASKKPRFRLSWPRKSEG